MSLPFETEYDEGALDQATADGVELQRLELDNYWLARRYDSCRRGLIVCGIVNVIQAALIAILLWNLMWK